jgi:hypothetical protein
MLPTVPADQPFTIPAGLAGTWTGYFEGYTLASGTDVVTLMLQHPVSAADQLSVVFGTDPPPPPPTDPKDAWFPARYIDPVSAAVYGGPFDGFPYLAHDVRWQGRRLTFSIATWDPWQGWCDLQTSYPQRAGGRSRCAPSDGDCSICYDPATLPATPCAWSMSSGASVVCAQFLRCTNSAVPCICDAERCESNPERNQRYDLTFDTDVAAAGTASPPGVTLRLMR